MSSLQLPGVSTDSSILIQTKPYVVYVMFHFTSVTWL